MSPVAVDLAAQLATCLVAEGLVDGVRTNESKHQT